MMQIKSLNSKKIDKFGRSHHSQCTMRKMASKRKRELYCGDMLNYLAKEDKFLHWSKEYWWYVANSRQKYFQLDMVI